MSQLRQFLKEVVPEDILLVRNNLWDFGRTMKWRLNPLAISSIRKMRIFKNIHEGQRCVIIGNGPSLNQMDLSLLKDEITFGLNRIYLLFDKMGFSTSYYVCINKLVIEQCADEIMKVPVPKFISWYGREHIKNKQNVIFLRDSNGLRPRFSENAALDIWEGATVTYVTLQIVYYMGFKEVILIGVDHNFRTKGTPHTTVVSEGKDLDHFTPDYFGKGFRWQLPDLETSELAYGLAKYYFERNGRHIMDATVNGKLQIFPKVDFEKIIKKASGLRQTSY